VGISMYGHVFGEQMVCVWLRVDSNFVLILENNWIAWDVECINGPFFLRRNR